MTSLLPPADAIAESQQLITAIEERRADLPFADDILAIHRSTHHELEYSHITSEAAVEAWRAALARRWENEIAGRRLYKQILRQLVEHFGEGSPQVQMLSRGGAEANSLPAELLEDLRRLQAGLTVEADNLPFAAERLAQLEETCAALQSAINDALSAEHRRRAAVLDSRMAREAYRRLCDETRRALAEHYGEHPPSALRDLLSRHSA